MNESVAKRSCGRSSVCITESTGSLPEHFLFSCYEELERLPPGPRLHLSRRPGLMRAFIESVPAGARYQSPFQEPQQSDAAAFWILLWAGELFLLLRATEAYVSESPASDGDSAASRWRCRVSEFASFPPAFSLECRSQSRKHSGPILVSK